MRQKLFVVAALVAGCGAGQLNPEPDVPTAFGLTLSAAAGVYEDGSGSRGVVLLATIRDESGDAPGVPWTLELTGESGGPALTASYELEGSGGFGTWWWPEARPDETGYWLVATGPSGEKLTRNIDLTPWSAIAVPLPRVTADGAGLEWAPVAGAKSYLCRVSSGQEEVLNARVPEPSCALGALADGTYSASVLAFSFDLARLDDDGSPAPAFPTRFDASEGRLAFSRDGEAAPFQLRAVGGRIHYGTRTPGLALWVGLSDVAGTPLAEPWSLEITGPDLTASNPLRLDYAASTHHQVFWSYDVDANPGTYTLVATSGSRALTTHFTVGSDEPLDIELAVSASPRPNGGANVSWGGDSGGASFFVGVWRASPYRFETGTWTTEHSADFAMASFEKGVAYDVYVAAASADLTASEPPARLTISENTYLPASFIAQ